MADIYLIGLLTLAKYTFALIQCNFLSLLVRSVLQPAATEKITLLHLGVVLDISRIFYHVSAIPMTNLSLSLASTSRVEQLIHYIEDF